MEFECYTHQAQQHQQQQQQFQRKLDSMANGSANSSSNTETTTTTITQTAETATNNNNNNNTQNSATTTTSNGSYHNNSNNNNNNSSGSNTHTLVNSSASTNTYKIGLNSAAASSGASSLRTADAATVAIAKDMLQLHHGGATLNNNNNNNTNSNNNNNSSSSGNINNSPNSSLVNEGPKATVNPTTITILAVSSAAPTATTTTTPQTPPITTTTTPLTNNPPAHLNNNNNTRPFAGGAGGGGDPPPATLSLVTSTTGSASTATTADTDSSNNNIIINNNNNNAATTPIALGEPPTHALGFLKFDEEILYITEQCTIIGRNSSTSHVHFHVAESNLVSRKHFQVLYDIGSRLFLVQCLSKNGIFVDDFLQRRNAEPLRLPQQCFFRFPSTEIRIQFESFVHPYLLGSAANNGGSPSAVGPIAVTIGDGDFNTTTAHHTPPNNGGAVNAAGGRGSGGSGGGNIIGMGPNANVIISPTIDVEHIHPHHHHQHHHPKQQQQQQQQHVLVQQQQGGPTAFGSSPSTVGGAGAGAVVQSHLLPMDSANAAICAPLKIQIPKKEQKSPYLSPTGTISAANSCPASPRQGFHQSQANYNNYSNNNLQNQDLFQTPSTASYSHNEKPPYSYAQLIVQAISAAPDKQLTLSGIYSFIVKHYPYYRKETNKGWQNSIRHNLSLNRYFIKVARSQDEPGKGSFWRIDPDSGAKLIDHSYKKRRQRSSQGFRPSYGMPRSAPVSPSHMEYVADNSRESSPLQDIVLQSAPGSPGMSIENRSAENDLMYTSQNMHQTISNNSHNQYNNSNSYFITNQNTTIAVGGGQQQTSSGGLHESNGGGGAALIAGHKRNHAHVGGVGGGAVPSANTITIGHHQHHLQQQHQQQPHGEMIYEELPTDYSGNGESGDECDSAKRPKYLSEML